MADVDYLSGPGAGVASAIRDRTRADAWRARIRSRVLACEGETGVRLAIGAASLRETHQRFNYFVLGGRLEERTAGPSDRVDDGTVPRERVT